jgi:DMSO/TMAO reductase YedYZ molybdopterin-dependent catalytic subunit
MKVVILILMLAGLVAGCTTKSAARAQAQAAAQRAYLAGQNDTLKQQLARQGTTITVVGPVQNGTVPWVAGLNLAQAIATANYLSASEPTQITLTRQGEDATIDPQVLFNGVPIPLEPGDVITLK